MVNRDTRVEQGIQDVCLKRKGHVDIVRRHSDGWHQSILGDC
jgi:hypothetical protein